MNPPISPAKRPRPYLKSGVYTLKNAVQTLGSRALPRALDPAQRRCLHPVVRERQSLVNQLRSLLRDLGLERRVRDVPDLAAYLRAKAEEIPVSPPD
jgi:hypothetical protein